MRDLERLASIAVLWALTIVVQAAEPVVDLAKEQRWADQIVGQLIDGEAEWLHAAGNDFLAIYTAAEQPKGAVILIHGSGAHPDWPDVIQPLRVALAEQGFSTLSVQDALPRPGLDTAGQLALADIAAARLAAARKFLVAEVDGPLFVLTHSLGAAHGLYYLAKQRPTRVRGVINVSMNAVYGDLPAIINPQHSLATIDMGVLDIYGSEDFPDVIASAAARQQAAGTNYQRKVIDGAGHFYQGHEEALLAAVSAWLQQKP